MKIKSIVGKIFAAIGCITTVYLIVCFITSIAFSMRKRDDCEYYDDDDEDDKFDDSDFFSDFDD